MPIMNMTILTNAQKPIKHACGVVTVDSNANVTVGTGFRPVQIMYYFETSGGTAEYIGFANWGQSPSDGEQVNCRQCSYSSVTHTNSSAKSYLSSFSLNIKSINNANPNLYGNYLYWEALGYA